MKRMVVIALTLLIVLNAMVFAGGQQDGDSSKQTLVVSSRLYSQPDEQRYLIDEIFPEFEEKYNCIVKFDILSDDAMLKRADFQKQTGKVTTDVVIAGGGNMQDWIKNEYVKPLPEWNDRTWSRAF